MTAKDRREDRHAHQVQIAARLDQSDYDKFEQVRVALGIKARRQAIIRAIREFIEHNESAKQVEQQSETATEEHS